MRVITDLEVKTLAALAAAMQVDYDSEDSPWLDSPFAWIKARPSRQVGKIGEHLIAGYLASKEFNVSRSPDSQADRIVEGVRVEIKFSTLWETGVYKFQQLRDQNYDVAICLGVSPFDAHCWVIRKAEILRRWRAGDGIHSQHSGATGVDTAWLSIDPRSIAPWLLNCGGTLTKAITVLGKITGFKPELSPKSVES